MTELERAIILLQEGRTKVEECAQYEDDSGYKEDLNDIAEDLTTCIAQLETFIWRRSHRSAWRGPDAKRIKAELKEHLK